eukprot:GHVP01024752.1.p1 GENE.GHVP01024752.1~~GHVP01024752.1.p1  ORF type:complete len:670 (-),score=138.51 GHVP01024752.1:888-2897(-)
MTCLENKMQKKLLEETGPPPWVAIILADKENKLVQSFKEFCFSTKDEPLCQTLTINGIPLIDHTMDFLADNSIKKIVIVASSCHRAFWDSFAQGKAFKSRLALDIVYMEDETQGTVHTLLELVEAQRDESKHFKNCVAKDGNDFLLMPSTTFVCGNIENELENHRRRVNAAKNIPCTKLFSQVNGALSSLKRFPEDDTCVGFYPDKGILSFLEKIGNCRSLIAKDVGQLYLNSNASFELRYDVIDPEIFLCSSLMLEKLNLQIASLDNDFIPSVLSTEYNTEGLNIGAAILTIPCSPIHCVSQFLEVNLAVSKEEFWDFSFLLSTSPTKNHIAENAKIEHSSFSSLCTVGSSTDVQKSVVLRGTTIGENCHLDSCLIAQDCTIGNNTRVLQNSVVEAGVSVGSNVEIPPLSIVLRDPNSPEGYRLENQSSARNLKVCLPEIFVNCENFDVESRSSRASSFSEKAESDGSNHLAEVPFSEVFHTEIQSMTVDALNQPEIAQHRMLEISTTRLSENRGENEIINAIVPVILQKLYSLKPPGGKLYDSLEEITAEIESGAVSFMIDKFIGESNKNHFYNCMVETLVGRETFNCQLDEKTEPWLTSLNPFYSKVQLPAAMIFAFLNSDKFEPEEFEEWRTDKILKLRNKSKESEILDFLESSILKDMLSDLLE